MAQIDGSEPVGTDGQIEAAGQSDGKPDPFAAERMATKTEVPVAHPKLAEAIIPPGFPRLLLKGMPGIDTSRATYVIDNPDKFHNRNASINFNDTSGLMYYFSNPTKCNITMLGQDGHRITRMEFSSPIHNFKLGDTTHGRISIPLVNGIDVGQSEQTPGNFSMTVYSHLFKQSGDITALNSLAKTKFEINPNGDIVGVTEAESDRGTEPGFLKHLPRLQSLTFDYLPFGSPLGRHEIRDITNLKNMRSFISNGSDIPSDALAKMTDLEELVLSDGSTQHHNLDFLKNLTNIKKLNLEFATLDDTQVGAISQLPQVRELSLAGTKITKEGLEAIKLLPNLKSLSISIKLKQFENTFNAARKERGLSPVIFKYKPI